MAQLRPQGWHAIWRVLVVDGLPSLFGIVSLLLKAVFWLLGHVCCGGFLSGLFAFLAFL